MEEDILELHYEGYTTGEIARELDLSEYEVVEFLRKRHIINAN